MKNKLAYLIATYFGTGLAPFAPGTSGSFFTLPLASVIAYFYGFYGLLIAALIISLVGWWATDNVVKRYKVEDPKWVVIDETAGQTITFLAVAPYLYQNFDFWYLYLIGFGFFRLFDIKKMGPVKWADSKLHNALGVMLDDIFAGVFATLCLRMVLELILYYHLNV